MNVDDYSENETHTVTSKYFTKNKDMDDSLASFKESKKIFVAPKSTKTSKPKPKKPAKKVNGQKDIRKVLKSNKNDIVKYTEEFENICKKSGIDVDADQLQLAIALSKSLQSENETVPTSPKLTIKERKNKIRTTLEEYGFKVPEIKIANKKVKKHRKEYKLLSKTDIEKQQILSDRYSQVLLKNLIVSKNSSTRCTSHLFNVATNVVYDILKDNSIYYVDDLIEKSNTSGCLFKDYANIPGRAISPELFEKSKMNFSEIECSQDELDIVLSGIIKNAKNVLNSKKNSLSSNINDNKEKICEEIMSNDRIIRNVGTINQKCFKDKYRDGLHCEGETKDINSIKEIVTINETKQYRSHSPDIFDDEVSILEDDIRITHTSNNVSHFNVCDEKFDEHICNKTNVIVHKTSPLKNNVLSSNINTIDKCFPDNVKKCLPLSQTSETTNRKSNDFMDLTECIQADDALCTKYTKLSQSNQTKRTSNDFMEFTECVGIVADHIDLIQNKNEEKETTVNIDLTQSSNSNESFDDLPIICLSKSNSLDATVILNENEYKEPNIKVFNNTVFDLSGDKVDKEENNIFDDFIHKHSSSESENQCKDENVEQIDLSQDSNDSIVENDAQNKLTPKIGEVRFIKTPTNFNEIFDTDYVRSKSVSPIQSNISNQNINKFMTHNGTVYQSFKYSNILKVNIESNDIDLTQSSDSVDGDSYDKSKLEVNNKNVSPKYIVDTVSKEVDIELTQVPHEADQSGSPEYSVLGKNDNISIDYDELNQTSFTENVCVSHNDMEINTVGNQLVIDKKIENDEENHSVFEIIDNELNYSLGKYRFENFELGGLSNINDLSKAKRYTLENEKHNITTRNDLPKVDLVKEHIMRNETAKYMDGKIMKTPGNSEYIIKTDDVTPMLNYATMASPERNEELEKYGIKPLKRKRAIQLLNHLYNQTHPIVESIEDLPTPSKRLCNSLSHIKSPKSDLTTKTWDDYERSSDRRSKIRTNIFGNLTPIEDSPNEVSNSPRKLESPQKEAKSPRKQSKSPRKLSKSPKVVNSEFNQENLNEIPCIKNIEYENDELVFQKREKAKIHSCRVPLHIAFHNYVSSKNGLREAILRYEPIDIEVVHKDLVAYGHRYDPKDLLRFMDKKCITVKYL